MALDGGIFSTPPSGGRQPAAAGSRLPSGTVPIGSLRTTFQSTFQKTTATVFDIAAGGGFDDQGLLVKEQDVLMRLRSAASANGGDITGGGGGGRVVGGAHAAPTTGPDPNIAAAERELLDVRAAQSIARLENVHNSLTERFPDAVKIASASTGTYDPVTFKPRSEDEARAFAQRMVVDLTEGAARLEVVKTKLDVARHEAGPTSRVATELQAEYARQAAYVDKLAGVVDAVTNDAVSDLGEEVLANGSSVRDSGDVPVDEIAREMRAAGMDQESIEALAGAGELAVEEDVTPGGSPRLTAIADTATDAYIRMADEIVRQMKAESRKDAERRRELDDVAEDRYADDKALSNRLQQRSDNERAAAEAAAQRRASSGT